MSCVFPFLVTTDKEKATPPPLTNIDHALAIITPTEVAAPAIPDVADDIPDTRGEERAPTKESKIPNSAAIMLGYEKEYQERPVSAATKRRASRNSGFFPMGDESRKFTESLLRTFTNDSVGSHHKSGGGTRRRRSSKRYYTKEELLNQPLSFSTALLENFVDPQTMPFLNQHLPLSTSAMLEPSEIKSSKLIGEGDYTRTNDIKGFKFAKWRNDVCPLLNMSSDEFDNQRYAIKTLHPKVLDRLSPVLGNGNGGGEEDGDGSAQQNNQHANDEPLMVAEYDTATRRLANEILYLSALSACNAPFILPIRGFYCFLEDTDTQQQQPLDILHLVTDRLGETLEQRMKSWKSHRQRLLKMNKTQKFILQSVQTDLADPATSDLAIHKVKTPSHQSSKSAGGNEQLSNRSHHKLKLSEQYPEDLVALQTNYMLQLAHALEFLHERGIVVRDLRPNTIGFKDFPNQHTLQLFHFGACRELPSQQQQSVGDEEDVKSSSPTLMIPPEPIPASWGSGQQTMCMSQSCAVGEDDFAGLALARTATFSRTATNSGNNIRRTMSKGAAAEAAARSPRAEAKHYRAPESYPTVEAPEKGSSGEPWTDNSKDAKTVTRTPDTHITCTTTTLLRYNTPPVNSHSGQQKNAGSSAQFQYQGYNGKADVYSLSMIYYELLAEGKPFGRNVLNKEGHYYRVQSHGLRPSLHKHHFPRTIKAVLEAGWNPNVAERSSAAQIRQRLTTILPMLEGKGLVSTTAATTGSSGGGGGVLRETSNGARTLPARAAALMIPTTMTSKSRSQRKSGFATTIGDNGQWSSVWSHNRRSSKKLDPKQVMDAIQAHRAVKKKKPVDPNKSKIPKLPSFKSFMPDLNLGMVKSEINETTAKILLGDKYEEGK